MTIRQENRDVEGEQQSPLQIRLFGPMDIRYAGEALTLRSGKAGAILALLLLRGGREVKREWLAETLWPDGVGGEGLVNLRQRLADLRRALGPAADRLVAPSSRTLKFEAAPHEVDLFAFDRAAARGDAVSLTQAASLYAGPLLEDYTEFWAQGERDNRQHTYLTILESLAELALADGSPETAIEFLKRGVGIDLFHQSATRLLMQAHALQENWEAALQAYADLRRSLLSLHGVEPEQETTRLYQELRSKARRPLARLPQAPAADPPCRIPLSLTPMIGRDAEQRELGARLLTARLVTLTGMGGTGKTRLALETARELTHAFPDGTWFADLSGTADPSRIPQIVAAALDIPGGPSSSWSDLLRDFLRGRHLLLILDNCEHLLAGCRDLARRLLSECPHLRILATSRQPLGLTGETVLPIPPLPLPPTDSSAADAVGASPAVQLFLERARALRPEIQLNASTSMPVADICRLLDGLPLALEIAAGLASVLSVQEITEFLRVNRLPAQANALDLPSRHTSLLSVLNGSYSLLTPEEQRLFDRLSVFAGGWSLDAARAVTEGKALSADDADGADEDAVHRFHRFSQNRLSPAGQGAAATILNLLRGLVVKSLVVVDIRERGSRYRMLETVREYAAHRLEERGEADGIRARHQRFFAALAADAEAKLTGPDQAEWLHRLQDEQANLDAALHGGGNEAASLRIAAALGRFWQIRGHFAEGRENLERLLAATAASGDTRDRADGMGWVALLAIYQSDYAAARLHAEAARDSWDRMEDRRGLAGALGLLALIAKDTGDLAEARRLFEASWEAAEQTGHWIAEASALGYLGIIAQSLGRWQEAEAYYRASLAIRTEVQDRWGVAASLNNLALLARDRGDGQEARSLLEQSIALRRALEDRRSLAISLNVLGKLYSMEGDLARAEERFAESMSLCRKLGDRRSIAYSLEHYADLAELRHQWDRAAMLRGAAEALRLEIGAPLTPDALCERDATLARLRKELGLTAFEAAWDAGSRTPLDGLLAECGIE